MVKTIYYLLALVDFGIILDRGRTDARFLQAGDWCADHCAVEQGGVLVQADCTWAGRLRSAMICPRQNQDSLFCEETLSVTE